jgi:polysaccharide chain length determinant protein (PEP-CTERM system associated)
MEKVAVATGLIPAGASERDKQDAVGMLQQNIKVIAQQDNIFELIATVGVGSLSDADNAKLASGVLDSLITVFRDEQLRGGRMNAREGLKFLDTQIADRETALRDAEAKRAAFEAQNIGMIPGGVGSPAMRLEQARSELVQIEGQLAAAQGALAAANGQLASTPATVAAPGLNATGGGVARQQLAGARNELASMRARGLTDAHPDVVALKAQMDALAAQAAREGTGGGGGTAQNPAYATLAAMRAERQATVGALSARKGQLNAEIAQVTAKRIAEPGIAAEYDRLNGDYRVLKDQYDKLLAQREQVRLRGQVETQTDAIRVDLTDPPTKPRSPVAPNRPLFLAIVLIAGIGAGVGAAFGLGQFHASYPTAAKLERASGLPVIGSITEVLTPARHVERKRKLVWLAGGSAALVGLFALLLVVEFIQRGMVA